MESLAGDPAAGVESVKLAGLGFVNDGEEVAADTVHHGFDDADHGVGCDRRVHCIAALGQDHRASLRCQRTFGGDDAASRYDHGAALRAVLCLSGHSEKRDGQEKEYQTLRVAGLGHVIGRKDMRIGGPPQDR